MTTEPTTKPKKLKISDLIATRAPRRGRPYCEKQHTATLTNADGNLNAYGATEEEALTAAAEAIRSAFRGFYTPEIVQGEQHMLIIWRTVDGWAYRITDKNHDGQVHASSGPDTSYERLVAQARHHFAHVEWQWRSLESPHILLASERFPDHNQEAFRHWARWQLRFRVLRAEGRSEHVAHRMASGSRYDEDLTAPPVEHIGVVVQLVWEDGHDDYRHVQVPVDIPEDRRATWAIDTAWAVCLLDGQPLPANISLANNHS